jgi:Lar family restriction alleviation protein
MNELKPCPFCGGEASISTNMDEDLWSHRTVKYVRVGCTECEIETHAWPESVAEEYVYDVWNRRV